MGRKRIQIEKIDCPMKRRTTYAKRSCGLLKKAKELAVLCDVGVGLVIISPTGKPQIFSNRSRIEQLLHQFYENTQEGNEPGMCFKDKEECKGRCCGSHLLVSDGPSLPSQKIVNQQVNWASGTNPSSDVQTAHCHVPLQPLQQLQVLEELQGTEQEGVPFVEMGDPYSIPTSSNMQSAHWHIPMQQMQVLEAEQEQMLGVPFVEMGYPFTIQTSVNGQFGSSEVRGPDGASEYMLDPLVGGCEVPIFSHVQPSSSMWDLPGGAAGNLENFSNQPRIEQVVQQVNQNTIPNNMPEEVMANLQGSQNVHIQVPIQHTQKESEAGMCSDDMEEWTSSLLESGLLESEDPSLPLRQIDNGPPSTNPLSHTQSAYRHIPMQQPQVLDGTEGSEQVQMLGVSLVEMENPSSTQNSAPGQFTPSENRWPFGASDYMLSPPGVGWDMPLYSDDEMELATLRWWSVDQ